MRYMQSESQDYRKLETFNQISLFLVVFSDDSDTIVDFWQSLPGYKTDKRFMISDGFK